MRTTERRRGNQMTPKDKQNYLVIVCLVAIVMVLIFRDKEPGQFVTYIISTVIGGLLGFLTGQHFAPLPPPYASDTAINARNVEKVTVQQERDGTQDLSEEDAPKK